MECVQEGCQGDPRQDDLMICTRSSQLPEHRPRESTRMDVSMEWAEVGRLTSFIRQDRHQAFPSSILLP